ncbi:MAG: tryptophanase [Planctomycetota bacterium]
MDKTWKTIIEPFKIKTVEPLGFTTEAEREAVLREACYNVFAIPADKVLIDLLTDSGTSAMSAEQWACVMRGDESYAGARSFFVFESAVRRLTGYRHVLPVHQGRAAERILFGVVGGAGKTVISNSHFDTTRANAEASGCVALDLPAPGALDFDTPADFKGDIDLKALEDAIRRIGAGNIPMIVMTVTNNSLGGQPVSMGNLRETSRIALHYGIPVIIDCARFAENAFFIKRREPGQQDRSVTAIVREMFDLCDGATISAKKDGLVNIGGVLLLRDEELYRRARNLLIMTEGFPTYGGLAGRDLEAMAQGFEEVLHEDYLTYRLRSTEYLGEKLLALGIQIVEPPGGHAIYVDAKAFCPHIPPAQFPGQAVVCAFYRHGGIRACEIGSVMFGKNASMELVRMAIPRRVYTQSHVDYVVEAVGEVFERRREIRGMRIVSEPPTLRHFTATFAEI